jgi:hypothetical protein
MVTFGKLNTDGSLSEVREIKQSDIGKCPHFIMVPEHYRADGSCRCDDPTSNMAEWGYVWSDETKRWESPSDNDTD